MVMALSALHVPTEQDAAQVSRDGVGIATSVQVEALLSALAFVPPCALDHFPHHLIDRQIGIHRIAKIPDPRRAIDVLERSALHHAFIEPIDHAFPMERIAKESIDPSFPTTLQRFAGKGIEFLLGWDNVSEIQREPSQAQAIRLLGSLKPHRGFGEGLVDLFVQGRELSQPLGWESDEQHHDDLRQRLGNMGSECPFSETSRPCSGTRVHVVATVWRWDPT